MDVESACLRTILKKQELTKSLSKWVETKSEKKRERSS